MAAVAASRSYTPLSKKLEAIFCDVPECSKASHCAWKNHLACVISMADLDAPQEESVAPPFCARSCMQLPSSAFGMLASIHGIPATVIQLNLELS